VQAVEVKLVYADASLGASDWIACRRVGGGKAAAEVALSVSWRLERRHPQIGA